jgi:type IV pilus assembly protein PilY1
VVKGNGKPRSTAKRATASPAMTMASVTSMRLGKGGKGLFSLDVTNPAAFAATNFRWERADTPLGNMGLVQGRPIIARVQGGANAVVLGNGVNSTNNRAVLVVLDLATGAVIREIDTGAGSAILPNGLSAPAGVLGPDGRTLSHVYAGDMLGNVWKFDLTESSPTDWSVTKLFEAGNTRPISGGVTLATHPLTNERWVFFGTGRYLTSGDVASTATQGMYGFKEDTETLTAANLTLRTLAVTSGTFSGYPVRAFQAAAPLPPTSKGWYINLPESGERIVQDAQIVSTFLITASMIPSGDACESSGRGYINALDAFTGTSAGGSYFDLDGSGSTGNEMIDGVPIGSVNVGVGMPTLPNLLRGRVVVGGSAGSELGAPRTLTPRWDRASWREIRRD